MTMPAAKCSVSRQSRRRRVAQCDNQSDTISSPAQVFAAHVDSISSVEPGMLFAVDFHASMSCSVHIAGYQQQQPIEGCTETAIQP